MRGCAGKPEPLDVCLFASMAMHQIRSFGLQGGWYVDRCQVAWVAEAENTAKVLRNMEEVEVHSID